MIPRRSKIFGINTYPYLTYQSLSVEAGDNYKLLTGSVLIQNQALAMFLKKFFYQIRNWKTLLIVNLLPVIFLIVTFIQSRNMDEVDPKPLEITLDTYSKATVVLQSETFPEGDISAKIIQNYQNMVRNAPNDRKLIDINSDFQDYILQEGETKQPNINNEYIVAATITKDSLTAWFNNQPYHAAPLTVNMLYNAILKAYCSDCAISVTNYPLPVSFATKVG